MLNKTPTHTSIAESVVMVNVNINHIKE